MHQDIDTHTSGRNRGTRDLLNDVPINAFRGAHVRASIKTEGTIKAHQTTIFISSEAANLRARRYEGDVWLCECQ